jgi:hypothetical protein
MTMIDQVASAMQAVLTSTAHRLGRETGFVQRESKLDGAVFTETLVFSYLANPQATLEELTQTAASLGVVISAPGFDQRFTPQAADLLQHVLAAAIKRLLAAQSWDLPILTQFSHVFVEDGTLIRLPPELAHLWRGVRNANGAETAALKLLLRMDLLSGRLETLSLHPGHVHDSAAAAPSETLPPGSLYLADLGFFSLARLAAIVAQQAFFLTRFKLHTRVWDAAGRCWDDIVGLLEQQGGDVVDIPVWLGAQRAVAGRLVAVRAPKEVVDQRRRRVREQARLDGRTPSAAQLAAVAWSIYITNVPAERLPVDAVLAIAAVRWQIELIFKTWKSQGAIDQSRSKKPWRVICDVYAKLLAMLVSHWVTLIEVWGYPERSLVKAIAVIRKSAISLAEDLHAYNQAGLRETLTKMARVMKTTCRMTTRKSAPNTYQVLMELSEHFFPEYA